MKLAEIAGTEQKADSKHLTKFTTAPVRAVKTDQKVTTAVRTLRGPSRSAKWPEGV
jgi:hypothetical protein